MQFRDLRKQYQMLKPKMDDAVLRVMTECNFISGTQVKELEQHLAGYVGIKHCITCGNGTDALTLALMACKIGFGDAVFVPDFTFFASAETPTALGATPVFVDVDSDTFNMDPVSLEQTVLRVKSEGKLHPRAVIAADLFGLCADYPAIATIAKKHGLLVIEDGAQSFGGGIGECRSCSFGDIATTSFFPAKPLGCYGDGGAVFTNDDEKASLIRSLAVHGKGDDKYDNIRLGMNSRLDTVQAAVLQVKLEAFEKYELNAVDEAASCYTRQLLSTVKTPIIPDGYHSSWAQYTIQLKGKAQRSAVQAALKAHNIPTMVYYPKAMHEQSAFSDIPYYGQCPVSEHLCNTVLSLPLHPYMSEMDVEIVCKVLKNCLA